MKMYVIAILAVLSLAGCAKEDPAQYKPKEAVAVQEEQKAEDTTTDLQKLTPYLKAVNRTWGRVVQSCWDHKSKTLLVQWPPTPPVDAKPDVEYTVGWQIINKPEWKEMGNGTMLFLGNDSMSEVSPDVTGMPCVMKDMVNK